MEDAALPLADRDVRLLARMLDRSAVLVAALPVMAAYLVTPPEQAVSDAFASATTGVGVLTALAIAVLQMVLLTVRGQSVGKIVCGLRIERPDGSLPGFVRTVVLREWVFTLFALCGFLAVIDVGLIFGQDRRTLHDRLADTRVVRIGGGVL